MKDPGQLLPAMARVHDIKEYGPVDDMVQLETQDLMSSFVKQVNDVWPANTKTNAKPYYLMAEYPTSSGKAGTLAFRLRAYLGNFERDTGWDCFATCFPMTGPLDRYVQLFRFWSDGSSPQTVYSEVQKAMASVRWAAPATLRLMEPTKYDRFAVAPRPMAADGGGSSSYVAIVPAAASSIS